MQLGRILMSGLELYTDIHVVITLVAIFSGFVVLYGMIKALAMPRWTQLFLTTTVLTSVTGFFFPFHGFTPALGLGIVSMFLLAGALAALYLYRLGGAWRPVYVMCAVAALYFNCFVLVVQSFLKIPPLHVLAPNGSEPPFAAAQGLVLVFFLVTGYLAVKRFRPAA